jgi:hypothetical protein
VYLGSKFKDHILPYDTLDFTSNLKGRTKVNRLMLFREVVRNVWNAEIHSVGRMQSFGASKGPNSSTVSLHVAGPLEQTLGLRCLFFFREVHAALDENS